MTLIACPDCQKPVSDRAFTCLNCGLPVAALLAQLRREEEEHQAEEEEQRRLMAEERAKEFMMGGVVVVIIAVLVVVGIVYSSQHPVIWQKDGTGTRKPGDMMFSAQGNLSQQYSCSPGAEKTTTVQFRVVNTQTPGAVAPVWKQTFTCISDSEGGMGVNPRIECGKLGTIIRGNEQP